MSQRTVADCPVVAVSVVVGAREELVFDCLGSLFATKTLALCDLVVTVICNDPESHVADRLRQLFPQAIVLQNDIIRGFAANHNRAIARQPADFYLVLNDDVVFYPETLPRCIAFLLQKENSNVGALSPRLLNKDGSLQPCTYSFPTMPRAWLDLSGVRDVIPTDERLFAVAAALGKGSGRSRYWAHDRTCDVDTFRGACMFVRAAAIESVGEMDEATLFGGEETEWHYRFKQQGWRIVFFSEADVIHHGSQTVGRNPRMRVESLKGYLNFFAKHRSRAAFSLFAIGAALVLTVRTLVTFARGDRLLRARCAAGVKISLAWLLR